MSEKPVIFISATSDLRSARDLVGKVLYSMGYEPVWQEIAATDGGELLDVLRKRLTPCAMVVQLVGKRYGAEPPQATADFGRVSYTQFEALEAERLGKKVIYHFLDDNFPVASSDPEAPDQAARQQRYRQRLIAENRLRHDRIADANQLELSIWRVRDELAALRRQSERRQRNLMWSSIAALGGIAIISIATFAMLHRQQATDATVNIKLDKEAAEVQAMHKELAAYQAAVAVAVAPKPLATGQNQPEPLSPEIVAKAKLLVERGDSEQRAVGLIALQQHEEANRIIQQLKSKPDNPIDEAFKLLTMEGDNWYQAKEPDKAIEPYSKAEALKPNDYKARNNLLIALFSARQGDIAANLRRAIDIGDGTLKIISPGSYEWASTQNNLGAIFDRLPTGNKQENISNAISAFQSALTVCTKEAYPTDWAQAQNNLGVAWLDFPTGDKGVNLNKSINAFKNALTVVTKDAHPFEWARTQNNLGNAWFDLPTGDRDANRSNAIAAYQNALQVFTKSAYPVEWAVGQDNLGHAFARLPTGDKATNLDNAIAAYQNALTVYTKDEFPYYWAWTQSNLGVAFADLPTGDKTANLNKALAAYQKALTVRKKDAYPADWAWTQELLGDALFDLPSGDKAANRNGAVGAYQNALTVYTKEAYPSEWGSIEEKLADTFANLPTDKAANLTGAIVAYENALTIYTKNAFPSEWARIQHNLGFAWSGLPTGDRAENLRKAIAAYENSLAVRTKVVDPVHWAATQEDLGFALSSLPTGDKTANLKKAIAAYRAALSVDGKGQLPERRRSEETELSGDQLLLRDFGGALATANREANAGNIYLPLEMNRAHALLFLGHIDHGPGYLSQTHRRNNPGHWRDMAEDGSRRLR